MRQINPMMKMGHLAADPRVSDAKIEKWKKRGEAAISEVKSYRLYHGEKPTSSVVQARQMEASAWNKNAAAFYAWQCSLGRDRLPLLEWREEKHDNKTLIYRVTYRQNGILKKRDVYASSKADAKKEFDAISSVSCVFQSAEPVTEEGENDE